MYTGESNVRRRWTSARTAVMLAALLGALCYSVSAGATPPAKPTVYLPPPLAAAHAAALAGYAPPQIMAPPAGVARRAAGSVVRLDTPSVGTVRVLGGNDKLTFWWTDTSGLPPGGYFAPVAYDTLYPTVPSGSCRTTGTTCSIGGLKNGHQYTGKIYICDSSGVCNPSATTSATYVARWPDPVSNLVAVGGDGSISATWAPPANNGGLAVDHYVVALYREDRVGFCYNTPASYATVTNQRITFSTTSPHNGAAPVNGVGYKVTVIAVNDTQDGYVDGPDSDCYPSEGGSQAVTSNVAYASPRSGPHSPVSGQFTPTDPGPLVDAAGVALAAGGTTVAPVLGRAEVPTTGVSAVEVNLAVTSAGNGGHVWLYDSDTGQPTDPTLVTNSTGNTVTLTVPMDAYGALTVRSDTAVTVHLDVLGFYSDGTATVAAAAYVPVPAAPLANGIGLTAAYDQPISTRGDGVLVGGVSRTATAVQVRVVATGASQNGTMTLYASNTSTRPDAPVLYYVSGQTRAVVTTVPLDGNGQFDTHLSGGTLTAQITVLGYYNGPTDPTDGQLVPVASTPVLDTGTGAGPGGSTAIGAGQSLRIAAAAGAPSPSGIRAEWLLVRPYSVTAAGTYSLYPTGSPANPVGVAAVPGADTASVVPVAVDSTGAVTIASDTASARVTVDVVGYTVAGAVPNTVTNVRASAVASGAYLNWTPPCYDGGAPIERYVITASPGGATLTVDGGATDAYFYGLLDGQAYTFTVTAVNVIGSAAASTPSLAVTPRPTVSDPPDQPGAQAGDASALVSWTAPQRDGDSPVTGYTVTGEPGDLTRTVAAGDRQVVMTGLTNGTAYTFTVTATNFLGNSQPSLTSAAVTPVAGGLIAPAALVRPLAGTPGQVPAPGGTNPCAPLAATSRKTGGGATTTRYELAGHPITIVAPPAALDLSTASLATLHRYGYAPTVTNAAQLAAWRKRIGPSHPVSATPCVTPHRSAPVPACTAQISGSSAGANPGLQYNDKWAGILAHAPSYPPADPQVSRMDTGNAFQSVIGDWTQGRFTVRPGGENLEASWVGIGGWNQDSHAGAPQLIQAGTAQQDNGAPYPWFELISTLTDTNMVAIDGLAIHPGDLVTVELYIYDPYKDFPRTVAPGPDTSYATFDVFDATTHQSSPTIRADQVYQAYDGRSAEWIDEDVTRDTPCGFLWLQTCTSLYVMPSFSTIHWSLGEASTSYGPSGSLDTFNLDRIVLDAPGGVDEVTPTCVHPASGSGDAWWDDNWTLGLGQHYAPSC